MPIRGRYNPFKLPSFAKSPFEIIKDGNIKGDNDNWRWIVVGDRLVKQVKISGNWETAEKTERPV